MQQYISIRGARVHNLKNININLPRNKLIVVTGVSGSGKSSLAFDTLYAEGQRRYVESLSAYARQFLERIDRPDVDEIKGISPALAIEQRNPVKTSRSTVGTATEIEDYLRLLFARIGRTFCPNCMNEVKKEQVQDVAARLTALPLETHLWITIPIESETEDMAVQLVDLRAKGFYRVVLEKKIINVEQLTKIQLLNATEILVLIDRLKLEGKYQDRLNDSIDLAFHEGKGRVVVIVNQRETMRFSQFLECANCSINFSEPQPGLFSFNNPFGACPNCRGFGDIIGIDLDKVVPDKTRSLNQGAIEPWNTPTHRHMLYHLQRIAPRYGLNMDKPFEQLKEKHIKLILEGDGEFSGLYKFFDWLETKKYKIGIRVFLSRYRGYYRCPQCKGTRLKPEAAYVRITGKTIAEICQMNIQQAYRFFQQLQLSNQEESIAFHILRELRNRLKYLVDVGLVYLTLDRRSQTLSGGEAQRINLATALGSQLVGSLYILDEPSIGLHPRDTRKLISILKALRDIGNTIVVVEHDRETIASSDQILDLGPRAGVQGGEVVFQGSFEEMVSNGYSLTGLYLNHEKEIPLPLHRRFGSGKCLHIIGATEHNLKNLDVTIPLGCLVVITGVSGSGKSSLIEGILYPALKRRFGSWKGRVGVYQDIFGVEYIDDVEMVNQSLIGRTPRSNAVTYINAFDEIRKVYAQTKMAKRQDYNPGTFSFNVAGGRCDVCEGSGQIKVEMQFLADIYLQCDACGGKRYKKQILQIRYRGKNIHDVLEMTVTEALTFFRDLPSITKKLKILDDVGLGYLHLGQPATTLSGGEAQRVKLAAHLLQQQDKHLLFLFDEPTTGLHFDDIAKLLHCFDQLIERGNSVIIIEHNLDVIKCADYIIDLGPEGGDGGGYIVAQGIPERIIRCKKSYTGKFLKSYLK